MQTISSGPHSSSSSTSDDKKSPIIATTSNSKMVNNAAADPASQAYRNTMEGMFSNKGVDELAPPPRFDYKGYELKWDEVDVLVERITDALIKIEDKTGRFRYQIADGRIIDSITWNFWEWPQAIGLNGLFDYYVLTSSLDANSPQAARTLKILKDWYQARHDEGTTTKNINTMSVLYSVACLVELDEQRGGSVLTNEERERFKGWMEDWAEWVMNDLPRTEMGGFQHVTFRLMNKNQLWDDTLMMTVLPLAKIGSMFKRQHYIEEAKYQFHIHIQYLMDSSSGLWYHGWEFDGAGSGHNYAKALWGRGNCWVTLAIPMFLSLINLPPTDPTHRHLLATFQRQVDGLLPLQDGQTGLWRTLLDDSTSYVESSATAGFVGGILMGIRLGYLDMDKYLAPALDGLKGCIAQVQDSGEVANVSKGTPVSMDKGFYKTIPRVPVPYGQSLLIVALGEWLRLADQGVVSK